RGGRRSEWRTGAGLSLYCREGAGPVERARRCGCRTEDCVRLTSSGTFLSGGVGFLCRAADLRVEVGEELRGEFFGGRLNQAAAKLGHLATHVSLRGVGEDGRVGAIFPEADICAALGKTCNAALAFT